MACTALINQTTQPLYFPLLDDPIPPGVRNLQYWIEDAWADGTMSCLSYFPLFTLVILGFDGEGAEDLRHKLVGTKKWIGTAGVLGFFLMLSTSRLCRTLCGLYIEGHSVSFQWFFYFIRWCRCQGKASRFPKVWTRLVIRITELQNFNRASRSQCLKPWWNGSWTTSLDPL